MYTSTHRYEEMQIKVITDGAKMDTISAVSTDCIPEKFILDDNFMAIQVSSSKLYATVCSLF